MLLKRRTKAVSVLRVAVVLIFCLMRTEASPLKTSSRQDEQKKMTDAPSGFQQGVIVFGKAPKNASADKNYQADYQGPLFDFGAKELQFNSMGPSVLCGYNQMKFRAFGGPVKHFALNQDPPLPLSDVPSACGYTIEGYPQRLVLHVPYDGCNIVIEDGHYNLPLMWKRIPVTLKCPKPDDVSTTVAPTLPPLFPFPWYPGMPVSQEPTTTTVSQDAQFPHMPPELLLYLLYHWPMLFPYLGQSTTTTTSPSQDQIPFNYWQYLLHMHKIPGQSATTPQDPVTQFPSSYWQYLLKMHNIPFLGQSATTQDQVTQFPSSYWQYLLKMHNIPFPGQSATTSSQQDQLPQIWKYLLHGHKMWPYPTSSPQNPATQVPQNYWQYIHSHPFQQQTHWHYPKGTSPTIGQQTWLQFPWHGHKWPTTTTTTTSGTSSSPTQTPWWYGLTPAQP